MAWYSVKSAMTTLHLPSKCNVRELKWCS